jgi:hypothetical protein
MWFLITRTEAQKPPVTTHEVAPIVELEANPEVKLLPYYVKTTAGDDQNQYVKLASKISGNNLDFILTLEAENGLWTLDRMSPKNKNGTRDYGLCQLNSQYHWNFIQSADFRDAEKQLQYCYEVFKKRPGAFYGYFKRLNHKAKFKLMP